MRTGLPVKIYPWTLIAESARLQGKLLVAKMPRLLTLLNQVGGEVTVVLEAGRDKQGVGFITGHLEARVEVICQRCLESMPLLLAVDFRLGLAPSETQLAELPVEYDPLLVVEEQSVDLSDLVEDEIILALPLAPMHEDVLQCRELGYTSVSKPADKPNPFTLLSALVKARDSKN